MSAADGSTGPGGPARPPRWRRTTDYLGLTADRGARPEVPDTLVAHLSLVVVSAVLGSLAAVVLRLLGWIDTGTAVALAICSTASGHVSAYGARWGWWVRERRRRSRVGTER